MTVSVVIVVAVARNGVIGRDQGMPWRVPSDLKHFRRTTLGRPIVMGRKTYESLGKPLDGRTNIVVTRDAAFSAEGVRVAASFEEALSLARAIAAADGVGEVIVGGGGQIYREALPVADRIVMTEIDLAPDGTTTFPPLDPATWREVSRQPGPRGPRDEADHVVVVYERVHAPSEAGAGET